MANIHDFRVGYLVDYDGSKMRIRMILTTMKLYYLDGYADKVDFSDPKLNPIPYDNEEALAETWDKYMLADPKQLDKLLFVFSKYQDDLTYIHELQNAIEDELGVKI